MTPAPTASADAGSRVTTAPLAPLRELAPWLGLAVLWTWPTAIHPVAATPGSGHTDLWESLWTMWLVATRVAAGASPLRVDGLLDTPHGGALWPADGVHALLLAPVTLAAGPAVSWSLLVVGHMALRGWLGFRIGRAFVASSLASAATAGAWVCGAALAIASMALADVHNGASEALGDTWVLAVVAVGLGWRPPGAGRPRQVRWLLGAGALLAFSAWAHWYGGVSAFLCWAGIALGGPGAEVSTARADSEAQAVPRARLRAFGSAAAVGLLLALPVALAARSVSTEADNVVGIKDPGELARIRRNIGPADPLAFVLPAPFRSPDFTVVSRYGEDYWHCPYLGWVPLTLAVGALLPRRRAATAPLPARAAGAFARATIDGPGATPRWPLAVAAVSVVLALGPVVTSGGSAWILPGRRAVPLPYFLVEKLPPFNALSLLWKLGWGAEVAVALLAAAGAARLVAVLPAGARRPAGLALVLAVLAEARLLAPTRGLPTHVDATEPAPILALHHEPVGKVMTWPLIGGLPTLYEQIGHGHMIAGTLNFPASKNAWNVTRALLRGRQAAVDVAKEAGVRYVVLHLDAPAGADESGLQLAAWDGFPVVAEDASVRVLRLW